MAKLLAWLKNMAQKKLIIFCGQQINQNNIPSEAVKQ